MLCLCLLFGTKSAFSYPPKPSRRDLKKLSTRDIQKLNYLFCVFYISILIILESDHYCMADAGAESSKERDSEGMYATVPF